jgi:hypothetical protein
LSDWLQAGYFCQAGCLHADKQVGYNYMLSFPQNRHFKRVVSGLRPEIEGFGVNNSRHGLNAASFAEVSCCSFQNCVDRLVKNFEIKSMEVFAKQLISVKSFAAPSMDVGLWREREILDCQT